MECCAKTGFNIIEVFRTAAHVLLSPLDDKNNGIKFGFTKKFKRKSAEIGEIFYHRRSSNHPSYRRKSAFA